eukprot:3432751-Prymnesium_polylepis.1
MQRTRVRPPARSRVAAISSPERNYHIFYQLLASRPPIVTACPALASLSARDLRMLSRSTVIDITGVDDAANFNEVCGALHALGVSSEQTSQLWSLLCGLLMLGNVEFSSTADDKAVVSNEDALLAAEELLGCVGLALSLTSKELGGVAGRTSFNALRLTVPQAGAARDSFIKEVYVRIFAWVCECINGAIGSSSPASPRQYGRPADAYIGLLDIFGFEAFVHNSFEQLCINFANERLQHFFLQQFLVAEEQEHASEGVPLPKAKVEDNWPCIELLEGAGSSSRGLGLATSIFALLDTQCKAPGGSEGRFAEVT